MTEGAPSGVAAPSAFCASAAEGHLIRMDNTPLVRERSSHIDIGRRYRAAARRRGGAAALPRLGGAPIPWVFSQSLAIVLPISATKVASSMAASGVSGPHRGGANHRDRQPLRPRCQKRFLLETHSQPAMLDAAQIEARITEGSLTSRRSGAARNRFCRAAVLRASGCPAAARCL